METEPHGVSALFQGISLEQRTPLKGYSGLEHVERHLVLALYFKQDITRLILEIVVNMPESVEGFDSETIYLVNDVATAQTRLCGRKCGLGADYQNAVLGIQLSFTGVGSGNLLHT